MTKSRAAQSQPEADLSEAARAVVHDPGDPRIDAHLAALGLGPDPAPTSARARQQAAESAELQALRSRVGELEPRVAELESALAAASNRNQMLVALAVSAAVVIVVLVLLLLL